jgi:hypothetical protein
MRRFDRWVPHPAAFSFRSLEQAVEAVDAPSVGPIIDPFVGAGTAATYLVGRGARVIGIEAHPLIGDLARAKLARPGRPEELRHAGEELVRAASKDQADVRIDRESDVTRRFIAAEDLAALVALRERLRADDPWAAHLRWATLAALRKASGSGWPYRRRAKSQGEKGSALEFAQAKVKLMADDLSEAPAKPQGEIIIGDSRSDAGWSSITSGSAAGSVSSPPYLNQVSYAEITRLELYFLGQIDSWKDLRTKFSEQLLASCTQQVSRTVGVKALATLEEFPGTLANVSALRRRLTNARKRRKRGKGYDDLLPTYFAEMSSVLRHLFRVLAPGARAAWVVGDSAPYGVAVDTPALLGVLASETGFEVIDDLHIRDRGQRWNGVGRRHRQPLSERLLIFQKPEASTQLRLFKIS